MSTLLERVHTRLGYDESEKELVEDLILTATDRINLRVGEATLPPTLESIAVEVVIKLYRRQYYEGIDTEGSEGISTKFIADVLEEYDTELNSYISTKQSISKVRFI